MGSLCGDLYVWNDDWYARNKALMVVNRLEVDRW